MREVIISHPLFNEYGYRDFTIMVESLYMLLHLQMAIRNRSRRNLQEEAIVNP